MKKFVLILILIFLCSFSVFTQTEKKSEKQKCPKIAINPPPIASPDEVMKFILNIEGNPDEKDFKIEWEIEKGTIVAGQGTKSLSVNLEEIDKDSYSAMVSVKVTGSNGCVVSANEGVSLSIDRVPFLVDEFGNITNGDLKARLDSFFTKLQEDANANGFIVMFGKSRDLEKHVKIISDHIGNKNFQSSRITFINGGEEKEIRTKFWIIPAGADTSAILIGKRPYEPICPAISVTPPPKALSADEPYVFVANVSDEKDRDELSYYWLVDKGKIIEGQGTKTIKVSAKNLAETYISASVHISGLPNICLDWASDAAIVTYDYDSLLFDEFGKIKKDELEKRIRKFESELRKEPSSTGYLINYGTPKQIAEIEKLIRNFISTRGYDASRMVFVNSGTEKEVRTRLWIVPQGADPSAVN